MSKETGDNEAGVIKVVKDSYISGVYVLIIDWNDKKDIGFLTKYFRTEIKNNSIFKFMNVEVGNIYDDEYAENPAKSFDITAYLGTAKIYGKVYIFHGGDKTFVISEYNKRKNEVSGFRKISKSLNVVYLFNVLIVSKSIL